MNNRPVNGFEWKGAVHAMIYGATVAVIAYFVAHGSLIAFIAVIILLGLAVRAWAIWYRLRHGLPLRRHYRQSDEPEDS